MEKKEYEFYKNYKYTPIKTGLRLLDDYDAFVKEDFMLIAGGTGTGKSFLSLLIAANVAKSGKTVFYYNKENAQPKILGELKRLGFDNDNDFGEMRPLGKDGTMYNRLIIISQQTFNVEQIKKIAAKIRPDLMILDLFNSILPRTRHKWLETAEAAEALSWFWKEYGCAVIVTEQLKNDRKRTDRPTEGDVKGGEELSNKATKILLLYNYLRSHPNKAFTNTSKVLANTIEVSLVKDRYGLVFDKLRERFDLKGETRSATQLIYNDNGKPRDLSKDKIGAESEFQEYVRLAYG